MTDAQEEIIQDPFHQGLGYAKWYDILQVQIEHQVEEALQNSCDWVVTLRSHTEDHISTLTPLSTLCRDWCTPILIQWCPACFGGMMFGKPTAEGGDIHTATDGNFHHCHWHAAGDCPHFYDPTYFLLKEYVNDVGHCIEAQHKRPAKSPVPLVPDEAIDQCETAYEAADGKKQKVAMDSFDDTGIMVLICCHDIPLFFANIDSPGEQQKYSVALLRHLFSLIPPYAIVVALYDVRCVLARSLSKALAIGSEMQSDLGTAAQEVLDRCELSVKDLESEWSQQQSSQLSVCAYAPARLTKELDTVLTLQADLDTSDMALQSTRLMLEKGAALQDTLEALEKGHDCLMAKVEVLYVFLNIHDQFPELEGINLDFVRLLLMVWDLKMNICKWAITSFFE
ncbi:hypothetical protein EDB19DRAFT_1909778 [Suillus lakei]|nr:hypothetical protein EDB19DRAFT_1909778 [Suillus lakei]